MVNLWKMIKKLYPLFLSLLLTLLAFGDKISLVLKEKEMENTTETESAPALEKIEDALVRYDAEISELNYQIFCAKEKMKVYARRVKNLGGKIIEAVREKSILRNRMYNLDDLIDVADKCLELESFKLECQKLNEEKEGFAKASADLSKGIDELVVSRDHAEKVYRKTKMTKEGLEQQRARLENEKKGMVMLSKRVNKISKIIERNLGDK